MKKWYQPCGWMLMAALALELSGCARGSAFVARMTGRHSDDQKLVDVDGKSGKKGSTSGKKSDSLREKAANSQLAKKSAKPKVESTDEIAVSAKKKDAKDPRDSLAASDAKATTKDAKATTKDARGTGDIAGSTAREKSDPFQTDELEALAVARANAMKAESESTGLAATNDSAAAGGSSRIQEVAHKVEDNLADLDDLPEWARDGEPAARREARPNASAPPKADLPSAESRQPAGDRPVSEPHRSAERAPVRDAIPTDDRAAVDLVSLCPDARGDLRELVRSLKQDDIEGLKRGVHRIGRMGPDAQAAAPALVHLLKHKDGFVRTHSALALARMQASPPEAIQTVVDGLKSTDPGLRSFAAAVLAEMGPQAAEALSALAESLNDRDGYVRLHAAEVLIRYDRWSYQALETLLAGLTHKDENIRWLATYSLAELAPESQETVDALLKATHDPVLKVRVGAVYALGEIGPFAKSAGGELRGLADTTTHQELQSAILYALQQIEQ